jgi:NAD(P)-dependent dehydrogenase (short-subunit alcohol dehydrogenase family)
LPRRATMRTADAAPRTSAAPGRAQHALVRHQVLAVNGQRVAIVTGAGSGIGKSASLALLKDGYYVGLVGRRKDMLEKTAAESAAMDRALVLAADITKDADVERVFSEVKSKFGRLDVLFNNAGMGAPAVPMEDLPIEKFREVVNINLVAMFMCTQHAIRIMKA